MLRKIKSLFVLLVLAGIFVFGIWSFGGNASIAFGAQDSGEFFPIGLYAVDDFYPRDPVDPLSKMTVLEELPQIAQAGFNVVHSYRFDIAAPEWGNTDDEARLFLDAAQKSGLKVLMGLSYADWIEGPLSNDKLNLILKRVRALKDHPALFGWVLNDDTPQGGTQEEGQVLDPDPEQLRKIRQAIKEIDVHPLVVAVPGAVDENYEYGDIADIYMPDNMPIGFEVIPPGIPKDWESHPEDVGKYIDLIYKAITPGRKVIAHIQIYNLANDSITWSNMPKRFGRYPSKAEIRFMTYNALIHKSQGVFFLGYRYDYKNYGRDDGEGGDDISPRGNPSQWKAIASVATELKSLTPIFLSPDATQEVTIQPENIEFLLKEYKNKLYLIAANSSVKGITATLTMSQPAATIHVLNESRSIRSNGISFTDNFDGYGVHCYEISPTTEK